MAVGQYSVWLNPQVKVPGMPVATVEHAYLLSDPHVFVPIIPMIEPVVPHNSFLLTPQV